MTQISDVDLELLMEIARIEDEDVLGAADLEPMFVAAVERLRRRIESLEGRLAKVGHYAYMTNRSTAPEGDCLWCGPVCTWPFIPTKVDPR